jgi:VIT1/CCC1 family predicted Fe2+/Mn2+ transporter
MGIFDYVKEIIFSNLRGTFRDIEHDVSIYLDRKIRRFERRIIHGMASFLIFSIAAIFLIIAAVFALIEYLNLGLSLSFLIIGVFLLLIGVIVKVSA